MTVVFDANILLLLLYPEAKPPLDIRTNKPIVASKERIEFLIKILENRNQKILIPTPVLSEILVRAEEAGVEYLKILNKSSRFKIVDFDQRAAIEVAQLANEDLQKPNKDKNTTQAKFKFDRQIIGIAKVNGADTIYSDDKNLSNRAKRAGLIVIGTSDLPLPEKPPQSEMDV